MMLILRHLGYFIFIFLAEISLWGFGRSMLWGFVPLADPAQTEKD